MHFKFKIENDFFNVMPDKGESRGKGTPRPYFQNYYVFSQKFKYIWAKWSQLF